MGDEDFLHYSDSSFTEKLKGAKACIRSLGITLSNGTGNPRDRVISIDYTAAAAAAFQNAFLSGSSASRAPGDKFRFVYISGSGVERDQERPLWIMERHRRLRVRPRESETRPLLSHSQ
jgi:hypothetical protein